MMRNRLSIDGAYVSYYCFVVGSSTRECTSCMCLWNIDGKSARRGVLIQSLMMTMSGLYRDEFGPIDSLRGRTCLRNGERLRGGMMGK